MPDFRLSLTATETMVKENAQQVGLPAWLLQIFGALLIALAAYIVLKVMRWVFAHYPKDRDRSENRSLRTLKSIAFSSLKAIVIFFAAVGILDLFGINTTSFITAAGISGIAIAFGAQKIIADVFSGFFILLDESFKVGDYVTLPGDISGTVLKLELRRTTIQDYSGALHILPNSEIGRITNFQQAVIRSDVQLAIPYSLNVEQVQAMIQEVSQEAAAEVPNLFIQKPYFIGVDDAAPLSYSVRVGATSPSGEQWAAARWIRARMIEKIGQSGAYAASLFGQNEH